MVVVGIEVEGEEREVIEVVIGDGEGEVVRGVEGGGGGIDG